MTVLHIRSVSSEKPPIMFSYIYKEISPINGNNQNKLWRLIDVGKPWNFDMNWLWKPESSTKEEFSHDLGQVVHNNT